MSLSTAATLLDASLIIVVFRSAEAGWACQAALAAAGLEVDSAVHLEDQGWEPDPAASPRERLIVVAAHPSEGQSALALAATIAPSHEIAVLLWWYGERPALAGRLPSRGALECTAHLPPAALQAKVLHAVDRARWLAGSRRAQSDAQRRGAQFDAVFRDSPDGLLEVAGSGRITRANRAICEISGYAEHELLGQSVDLLVPDSAGQRHASLREQFAQERQPRRMARGRQLYLRSRDGGLVPVEVGLVPLPFADQRQVLCMVRDLREMLRLGDQLAALHAAVDAARDAVAIFSRHAEGQRLIYANRAMASLCTGPVEALLASEAAGEPDLGLDAAAQRELTAAMASGRATTVNSTRGGDGRQPQHLELQLSPVHGASAMAELFLLLVRDTTATVRQLQRLSELAARDPLTGLANRAEVLVQLEAELDGARGSGRRLVAAMVDLDRFRQVNEAHGHGTGDAVLAWLGRALQRGLTPRWQIGRWGGDRFVLFAIDDAEAPALAELQALRDEIQTATPGPGLPQVRLNLGLAFCPDHAAFASDLVDFANIACQLARHESDGQMVVFDQAIGERRRRELHLQCVFGEALRRGELSVVYQPQIDAHSGRLRGCEALARWRTSLGEVVPPAEFVRAAERAGLVADLDAFVAASAHAQLRAWRAEGLQVPQVSLNASPHSLVDGAWAALVGRLERAAPGTVGDLRVEFAEGVGGDPRHLAALTALAGLGVALSMADFGASSAGLSALRRLPLREIKLDRSLLSDPAGQAREAAIVRSVIGLAHQLDLQVVAEGVETESQARWLRANGCDALQGYHFAPGLPADEFAAWCGDRLC